MQSKSSRAILIALGAILITALVAGAGFFIEQSNGQVKPFIKPDLRASGTKEPHGAAGSIQKIEGQTLYIQTRDGKAQIILIDSETRIEKNQKMIGLSDLKEGDSILVVGSPAVDGMITARMVRVLDRMSFPKYLHGLPDQPKCIRRT